MLSRGLTWIRENERRLSTLLFVGGFVTDVIAFTFIDLPVVNLLFLGYLAIAALLTFITHTFRRRFIESVVWWKRAIAVLPPLFAQFTIGGLLSGSLIFYTKSATLSVSWPFLLLLIAIFLGNEYFRSYRAHLVFQTMLFFFALYAYLIFALPLYAERLGPTVFLASTACAVGIFAFFLYLLSLTGRTQLAQVLPRILAGTAGLVASMMLLYFSGLIPPIPLTLKGAEIAHSVERSADGYVVIREQGSWLPFWEGTIHHTPGTPLYTYSSVFAPGGFSANIVHRWERYDAAQKRWITETIVAFPLSGGREGGFRGYSQKSDPLPGRWRVSVETVEGQVVGLLRFRVENVQAPPTTYTEIR